MLQQRKVMRKLLLSGGIALLTNLACPAQEPSSADAAADITALRERLGETRQLLDVLDATIARLSRLAEDSLDRADSATDYDERARYEALYSETGARIGELQLQRDKIEELLIGLEAKLNPNHVQDHDR